MSDDVFGLSEPDVDEVLRIIDAKAKHSDSYAISDTTALTIAYTSGGATARSGSTLGKGTAVKYYLATSGTDRVITICDDTDPVTFYNMSTTAVGSGKYVMLLLHGVDLVCNWEDCT